MRNTHSVDEFVADKAPAHLGADQLESAGQIVGRLVVVVLQLMQDLLVVIGGLAAHQRDSVVAEFGFDFELVQKILRPSQRFVIRIEWRVDGGRARVDTLDNVHHQVLLFGRFVLFRGRVLSSGGVGVANFDAGVREKVDATSQRLVAVMRAGQAGDGHDR